MSEIEFKIYAKIKAMQCGLKSIDVLDPKTLQIKRNNDINLIHLNWILSALDTQEKTYQMTAKKSIQKLIQGYSSLIFCYGGQSSGKTYTLIGREEFLYSSLGNPNQNVQEPNKKYNFNQKGVILRTIQYIFNKAKSYQHLKHFIVSCSCIEMRKEKIIDLGRQYLRLEGQSKDLRGGMSTPRQFINIQEDKNGNFLLNNLTITTIKNISNFTTFLKEILKGRQQQNSHFILEINLLQSDKEKSDAQNIQSSITFVELGYLTQDKQQKIDEGLVLQTELNSLSQILKKIKNIKNIQALNQIFRQTKLTRILKNSFQKSSMVSLIGNLQLTNERIEQSLSTINYLNRCKSLNQPKQTQQNYQSSLSELRNKYNKQLKKYDMLVEENKQKIQLIQEYIGVEINLNDIHKNTLKQISALNNFKQAIEKVKYLSEDKLENQKEIQDLEIKINKQSKMEEERYAHFLQKKTHLEKQKEKIKEEIFQMKSKEKIIFKEQIHNFEKAIQLQNIDFTTANRQNKQKYSKYYESFSKISNSLTNHTEVNFHIEQTQISATNQAKEKFLKKLNSINEMRQQNIVELQEQYKKKKRNLQKKSDQFRFKNIIFQKRNLEISAEIINLSQLIQRQEKFIRQSELKNNQSTSLIIQIIKKNRKNCKTISNFDKIFEQCLKQSKLESKSKNNYNEQLIKFYEEQLFQLKMKKKS